MKLKYHWYSQISWIIGAYEGRISWIFGALELRIYWITANLQDIRSLWSVKFPDIWGLWSTTIQDICKSPGNIGPRASTKGQVGRSCTIVPALTWSVPLKKLVLKSFVPVRRPNFNLLLMPYWSMKLKSHIYLWISYLFRALEARIYWIIANLLDDCKSPGWLQISWMIANLLDIQGLWSSNLMYIFESPRRLGPIGRESQGYLGPMKHKSPVYLRNSGILGAMITCILANLLQIP